MKLILHRTEDGFKYFEFILLGGQNLIAFTMIDLTNQLWDIYGIDKRMHLFNPCKN